MLVVLIEEIASYLVLLFEVGQQTSNDGRSDSSAIVFTLTDDEKHWETLRIKV